MSSLLSFLLSQLIHTTFAADCLTDHECDPAWIGDGWCDENCGPYQECSYDLNDCNGTCSANCGPLWSDFLQVANLMGTDYLVSNAECGFAWSTLESQWDSVIFNYLDCASAMAMFDLDFDNKLNGFELTNFASAANGHCTKIGQVNCSTCADSVAQFYGNNTIFYDGSDGYNVSESVNFCNNIFAMSTTTVATDTNVSIMSSANPTNVPSLPNVHPTLAPTPAQTETYPHKHKGMHTNKEVIIIGVIIAGIVCGVFIFGMIVCRKRVMKSNMRTDNKDYEEILITHESTDFRTAGIAMTDNDGTYTVQ